MAHKLVGTLVEFSRPVIVSPAVTKYDNKTDTTEHIPAELDKIYAQGIVIGVVPQQDEDGKTVFPILQLAFLHPDRLSALGGSGWRDAFDRLANVKPSGDKSVRGKPVPVYNEHSDEILQYLADAGASPAVPVVIVPPAPVPVKAEPVIVPPAPVPVKAEPVIVPPAPAGDQGVGAGVQVGSDPQLSSAEPQGAQSAGAGDSAQGEGEQKPSEQS